MRTIISKQPLSYMDIVIAAGGVGSRMSLKVNPNRSKPLIKYRGKELLHLLIESALNAGFSKFFISVNKQNYSKIREIVNRFQIYSNLKLTSHNFAGVPIIFKNLLSDRFLLVCGHNYIPSTHFKNLLKASRTFDLVTTAYENKVNLTKNKRRIILNGGCYQSIDLNTDTIPENHTYVRNPYIINHSVLEDVIKSHYKKTAGYFIFKAWQKGIKVGSVKALAPVEFDTDAEFKRLKTFLDGEKK